MSPRRKFWERPQEAPGTLGILSGFRPGRGNEAGPDVYGGVPQRATIPATGPKRRDDFPPCQTRCHGRKCGKRVAHQHEGKWRCISCGEIREEPTA